MDITYGQVAKFFADKNDSDELAYGNYETLASVIWELKEKEESFKDMSYEEFIKENASDDKRFAFLIIKRIKKQDGKEWGIIDEYLRVNKSSDDDFYEWFINRCKPNDGEYRPGQKWHIFEYMLYHEMNKEYGFSKCPKKDVNDKFIFYERFIQDLKNWMTREANLSESEYEKLDETINGYLKMNEIQKIK